MKYTGKKQRTGTDLCSVMVQYMYDGVTVPDCWFSNETGLQPGSSKGRARTEVSRHHRGHLDDSNVVDQRLTFTLANLRFSNQFTGKKGGLHTSLCSPVCFRQDGDKSIQSLHTSTISDILLCGCEILDQDFGWVIFITLLDYLEVRFSSHLDMYFSSLVVITGNPWKRQTKRFWFTC